MQLQSIHEVLLSNVLNTLNLMMEFLLPERFFNSAGLFGILTLKFFPSYPNTSGGLLFIIISLGSISMCLRLLASFTSTLTASNDFLLINGELSMFLESFLYF
jgi:hypothetical protein